MQGRNTVVDRTAREEGHVLIPRTCGCFTITQVDQRNPRGLVGGDRRVSQRRSWGGASRGTERGGGEGERDREKEREEGRDAEGPGRAGGVETDLKMLYCSP